MDYDFKWIRPNMSLYHIDKNCPFPITLLNSGNLADDFNKYADYTEVETMPKLSFKYREYQGFLLKISAS